MRASARSAHRAWHAMSQRTPKYPAHRGWRARCRRETPRTASWAHRRASRRSWIPILVLLITEVENMRAVAPRSPARSQCQRGPPRARLIRDAPRTACRRVRQSDGRRTCEITVVIVGTRGDFPIPGPITIALEREPVHQMAQVTRSRRKVRGRHRVTAPVDVDRAAVDRVTRRIA
jgi:hypothetical protein